jgi:hypothetical protein
MVESCRNRLGFGVPWMCYDSASSPPSLTFSKILYSFKNALRTIVNVDESDFSCGEGGFEDAPLTTNFRGYNLDPRYLFRPRSKLWEVRNEVKVDTF